MLSVATSESPGHSARRDVTVWKRTCRPQRRGMMTLALAMLVAGPSTATSSQVRTYIGVDPTSGTIDRHLVLSGEPFALRAQATSDLRAGRENLRG